MEKEKFGAAVTNFLQEYYGKHKKIPSTATLFKSFNKTKFYEVFPQGLAQACRAADVPVPEERLKRTQKARQATNKKRVEEVSPLQDLKQSYEIQQREEQHRKLVAEKCAEELAIALQDSNEAISRLVLDAMEKTALPILLKKKYGIDASVPEILEMLKQYKKAVDEGWYLEHIMEWGILSEDEREAFRELREKAYDKGLPVNEYIEGLKAKSGELSGENERLSRIVDGLKLEEKSLNERCSRLNTWLEEDYQRKKKGLEEKYLQDIDDYKREFLEFKGKMQAMREGLQNDYNAWEAKCNNLKTECGRIEKQATNMIREAKNSLDKIKGETAEAVKERDTARNEFKQLRALVGPKGTVADLAKQKEDLKAQLAEKDRQLTEKAMQVAGKWLNQEEAIQEAEGVYRFVLDEVERRINTAGPALYVLEFLESELPDDKFRELTSAINLAQVKRESQNPDNPYFADLPLKKGKLSGAFPDSIEEYKRLHNEKMESLEGQRGIVLNQIRRDAMGFGIAARTIFGLLGEVMKPLTEAYFNPRKPRQTTPANNDRREPDRSS